MDKAGGDTGELRIAGYGDIAQIGRGASSNIFKGFDSELNRWVAIKVLLADDPDDPARKRFKREGEITANLGKHPHIVQVLGTGFTESGHPYVVMELFEQGSIADRLRSAGAFTVDDTLDIGEKIADAVAAAHKAGVLHRDIKPQNILLSEYGPALADFGIARAATNLEWSQSLDQLTPLHSSPEVLMGGTSTAQSDIYSVGSTLYTMLAGRAPFAGSSDEAPLQYQVRALQDPVPSIPRADIPPELTDTLSQALAKNPGNRHGSAGELRDALRAIRHGSPLASSGPASQSNDERAPQPLPTLQGGSAGSSTGESAVPTTSRLRSAEFHATPSTDAPTTDPRQVSPTAAEDRSISKPAARSRTGPDVVVPLVVPSPDDQFIVEGHTVVRGAQVGPLGQDEPAGNPPKRRWITLVVGGSIIVGLSLLVVFVFASSGPESLPIKHVSTTTIESIDQPTGLTAIPTGSTIDVHWQDPTNGVLPYLVETVNPGSQKSSSHLVPRGQDTFTPQGLSPNTRYCFEVAAIFGTGSTFGKPGQVCATSTP